MELSRTARVDAARFTYVLLLLLQDPRDVPDFMLTQAPSLYFFRPGQDRQHVHTHLCIALLANKSEHTGSSLTIDSSGSPNIILTSTDSTANNITCNLTFMLHKVEKEHAWHIQTAALFSCRQQHFRLQPQAAAADSIHTKPFAIS